jgi:hypothetical protein
MAMKGIIKGDFCYSLFLVVFSKFHQFKRLFFSLGEKGCIKNILSYFYHILVK